MANWNASEMFYFCFRTARSQTSDSITRVSRVERGKGDGIVGRLGVMSSTWRRINFYTQVCPPSRPSQGARPPPPGLPFPQCFFLFTLPDWQRLNELRKLMCNFGSDFSLLFFLAYLTGKFICISGLILFLFCALPLYDRLIANTPILPAF